LKIHILVAIKTKCKDKEQIFQIVKKLRLNKFSFILDENYIPKIMPNNMVVIRGLIPKKEIKNIKKLPRVINIFNDQPLIS